MQALCRRWRWRAYLVSLMDAGMLGGCLFVLGMMYVVLFVASLFQMLQHQSINEG